ncbi:Rieske iron-sulfur protein [Megalopta genalis]|uniref:Rieske iron-sulfur protein n=1 Tax=Megalopta genalis TaxID=115081 RepID=UPI003FD13559
MNVVAKSPNVSPILKAATTVVTNGFAPVAGSGVAAKPKILVKPVVSILINQSISDSLFCRSLRVSSGITGATQTSQKRWAHTDIQWPDFTPYRNVKNPEEKVKDNQAARRTTAYLVTGATVVSGIYVAKGIAYGLVSYMSASADVLAMAKIEVDLSTIPEGKSAVFKWRGKPLFVRHRSAAEIAKEGKVDISILRDPQNDLERVKQPEWLVVLGVCTHLGCVPIANAGDFGGYYCPCHGSHYDASGRIRKGPAPLNLEVPQYEFTDSKTLLVG